MLLRSFFRIYRKRLAWSTGFCLATVLLIHMIASAHSLTDVGVFWHNVCSCPLDPDETRLLFMSFSFIMFVLGVIFGVKANANSKPAIAGNARFLLTRPTSRLAIQFYPFAISAAAIILLPPAAWLLLLGWLRLVGAPSLNHLTALVELIPAASTLGAHPSLVSVLSTLHFGRFYLGQISVGLSLYALFASRPWFVLSPRKWLSIPGAFIGVLLFSWYFALRIHWVAESCLLLWAKDTLYALPSPLNIALHFAFIALVLAFTAFSIREAEL